MKIKVPVPVKPLGGHVKSSSEMLQDETSRVQKMVRLPQFQQAKGAASWSMKHKGGSLKKIK